MKKVDLNCDLGESFGVYALGMDRDVLPLITSANVACGWHAGDPSVMDTTVGLAKENGVSVGAHPGYPDLLGFGRRNMSLSASDAASYVQYQLGALSAFTRSHKVPLNHIKLHGAFYNMAAKDRRLSEALCRAIKNFDPELILLGLSGSAMLDAAEEAGLRYAGEVFADRMYEDDGSLMSREKENAVIRDSRLAIDRVIEIIQTGTVTSVNGKRIPILCHSVCVHGDNPHAVEFCREIRACIEKAGIALAPLPEIVK